MACSSVPVKNGLTTGAVTTAVTAASVLTGSAIAPILAAGAASMVTSAVVSARSVAECPAAEITAETVVTHAPDNLWSVVQRLVELGGIGLILALIVVPLLVGWITPGPTRLNRK